ncbi:MAG: BolA/IbaG family iron-sulfur metabolism protein [Legionellaceae bacterium]|nr:BolA/IbaG family iron-sulfur metabolism protein [Legionellaceae bacterium]
MLRAQRLDHALFTALKPDLLHIENESNRHQVPAGSESHFKVIIVSSEFNQLTRIARHRLVNSILAQELKSGLHALTLSLHTPAEWIKQSDKIVESPPCQHTK